MMSNLIRFYDPRPWVLLEYEKGATVPVSQLYAAMCRLRRGGDQWIDEHGHYHMGLRNERPSKERQDETTKRYHWQLERLRKQLPLCPLLIWFQGGSFAIDQGRHRLAAIKAYSAEIGCDLMVSVLFRKFKEHYSADYREFAAPSRFPEWLACVTTDNE